MAGVITDACIKCKYRDCVEVCPVDAFYEGENMLVINPLECVDCGCCIEECPVDAIVFDTEPRAQPWIELNAQYSLLWPNIVAKGKQGLPDADQFRSETGKFDRYFSPEPGAGEPPPHIRSTHAGSCAKCRQKPSLLRRATLVIGGLALFFALSAGALILLGMLLFSFNPGH
jgi:ferredoxin